jgi:hypothetical protein
MSIAANIGLVAAAKKQAPRVPLSVIMPVYNEAGNIAIGCG